MNKKAQSLVIKLSSSEALAFSGCFGLVFALPNFYQIFLEQVFPIIIETSTTNIGLYKFLYFLLLVLITYESYHWIIQLANNMQKTQHLNVDYNLYMIKVVVFGLFGLASAVFLNRWLF